MLPVVRGARHESARSAGSAARARRRSRARPRSGRGAACAATTDAAQHAVRRVRPLLREHLGEQVSARGRGEQRLHVVAGARPTRRTRRSACRAARPTRLHASTAGEVARGGDAARRRARARAAPSLHLREQRAAGSICPRTWPPASVPCAIAIKSQPARSGRERAPAAIRRLPARERAARAPRRRARAAGSPVKNSTIRARRAATATHARSRNGIRKFTPNTPVGAVARALLRAPAFEHCGAVMHLTAPEHADRARVRDRGDERDRRDAGHRRDLDRRRRAHELREARLDHRVRSARLEHDDRDLRAVLRCTSLSRTGSIPAICFQIAACARRCRRYAALRRELLRRPTCTSTFGSSRRFRYHAGVRGCAALRCDDRIAGRRLAVDERQHVALLRLAPGRW